MRTELENTTLGLVVQLTSSKITYFPHRLLFEKILRLVYEQQQSIFNSLALYNALLPFIKNNLAPKVPSLKTGASNLREWYYDAIFSLEKKKYITLSEDGTTVSIKPKYLDFLNLYLRTQESKITQTKTNSPLFNYKSLSEEMYDYSLLMSEIYPDLAPPTKIERNHCTLPQYTQTPEFNPIQEYNLDNIRIPPMFDTLEEKQHLYKVWLHNGGNHTYLPEFTEELHQIFLKQYNQEQRATPEFQAYLRHSQEITAQILQQRKQALQPNGTLYFKNSRH